MALDFALGKRIVIFASELASAIDQHPYQDREETAFKVWKRFDQTSFAFSLSLAFSTEVYELCKKYINDKPMRNPLPDEVESELGKHQFTSSLKEIFSNREWLGLRSKITKFLDTKTFGEAKEKVLLNLLGESERISEAVTTLCHEEKKSVEEKVDEVCKTIAKETGKSVDQPTQDALASKLRRERGTNLEAKTVTDFAITTGKKVQTEPAKLYRKVLTYNDMSWLLVGRIDARDDNTIVEVKNRTRRFMCPEYDILQLQAYMYLCDKTSGILLERLHGENRETPFEFNDSYWNEAVIPAMYEFVQNVEERVIMGRSILDGVTPPISPRKRGCEFDDESPSKVTKIEPSSPIVLQGSSWDSDDHHGDRERCKKDGSPKESSVSQGSDLCKSDEEVCEELFGDNEGSSWANEVLHASSWDSEPSSDLGENTDNSFTLYLSPTDTESDEELANMPLENIN